jgi:hypothetical protein
VLHCRMCVGRSTPRTRTTQQPACHHAQTASGLFLCSQPEG